MDFVVQIYKMVWLKKEIQLIYSNIAMNNKNNILCPISSST